MGWVLSLVVSVYDRDAWCEGLPDGAKAKAEKQITAPLPLVYNATDLSTAMRVCGRRCESWLAKVKPDLAGDVVLVTYSIEVK